MRDFVRTQSDTLKPKEPNAKYADFNSFVPQYCMMTENQRRYYIWWRTCIRNGRYIYASKSYILLLLYEIINLPDLLPPNEGVRIICRLICGYHDKLCGIRNSVAVWLRDYCLIHEVEIPPEYMERIAEYAGKYTSFSEFFVKYDPEQKLLHRKAIYSFCRVIRGGTVNIFPVKTGIYSTNACKMLSRRRTVRKTVTVCLICHICRRENTLPNHTAERYVLPR